jgi:hypothetical protein
MYLSSTITRRKCGVFVTAWGFFLQYPLPIPFTIFPLTQAIPHGLVEHKARSILDPALYSER